MGGGSYAPGFEKFYNGATFAIQGVTIHPSSGDACKAEPGGICHDWSLLAATSAVIYRGNSAASNGGFQIGGALYTKSIRDVIIEGNTVSQSDKDKALQIDAKMVDLFNGTCVARANFLGLRP